MAELTDAEKATLERLKKFAAKVESIPEDQKMPFGNPGKWAYPATIDERGNLIPEASADPGT